MLDVGGPVHVATLGDPPAGAHRRTVVCLHGLGGSHLNWLAVAPGLSATARVVAVDLVGHGRTPATGRTADVDGHVALVTGVLEALAAGPVTLVGNSMGGLVAAVVAGGRPDLVDRLVLVDPALPPGRPVVPHPRVVANIVACGVPGIGERFLAERRRRTTPAQHVRRVLAACCHRPWRVDPAVVDAHVALTASIDRAAADAAYLASARSLSVALLRPAGLRRVVDRITAPTLLLHGERDLLVPLSAARQLAAAHPAWVFEVVKGVGHVPMLEAPAWTVARIRSFEATLEGSPPGGDGPAGGGRRTGVGSAGGAGAQAVGPPTAQPEPSMTAASPGRSPAASHRRPRA